MNPVHRDRLRLGQRRTAVLASLLLLLALFPSAAAGLGESLVSALEPKAAPYEVFEVHLDMLNEFEDRRRSNVYFENEQSLFYGAQVGHVNVGKGNLTFLRRDLVTVGRIPLVVARVYDSSLGTGGGFGRGWRLAAAETLTLRPDGSAVLVDESGTATVFLAEGERLVADPPRPSDISSFERIGADRFRLRLATGFVKDYALADTGDHGAVRLGDAGRRFVLARVADRNGNAVTLSYRGGHLAALQDADGRRVTFARGAGGRIESACDEQARCVAYRYDARARLAEVLDLGGKSWRYVYDDDGRLVRAFDPAGGVSFTAAYDERGRTVRQEGLSIGYRFDYGEGVTVITDVKKRRYLYRQNADGVTVAVRNALGTETEVELDGHNRVHRLYRDAALELELAHRADGRLASLTRPGDAGPTTRTFEYDRHGRLTKVSGDAFLRLGYDPRGNVIERIDAEGRTFYGYDERGDLATLSRSWDAAPGVHVFGHDAFGQITSIVAPDGTRTELSYRPSGQLAEIRYGDGTAETFRYDGLGMRLHREFANGGAVEYDYSPAGSILEVRVKTEDGTPGGQVLTLDEHRRVTKVRDHSGQEVDVTYDAAGNVTALRKEGEVTVFRYDAQDRFTEVVTSKGEWLRYDYAEGEVDLRIQADRKTRENPSPRISSGLTFASSYEVLYNRTARSDFGAVTLDASLAAFRPAADLGAVPADTVIRTALDRMRLLGAEPAGERSFGEPSNILFVPAEYASMNCCNPTFCLTCSPDPMSRCYDGGGGGPAQTNCLLCCAVQGTTCRNTYDAAVNQALLLLAIAEGACAAGPCTNGGDNTDDCIACIAAAGAAFALRLLFADQARDACCAARTNTCRLSTNDPLCDCTGVSC